MEYTKDNPLRVFTAFSGYDSQCLALKRLAIPFDLVGWSEIDKYAIQAHDVLFPEYKYRNYGDISKIDWIEVPDFDLFTYSFPCTNLSFAGKQEGFDEGRGTASSLLWECRKAIVEKKPKYLLMENVKALLSAKFKPMFMKWQNELASYGYTNFVKVLDSSQFGVPQHRERVFMVSILDENASYHFPEPFPLDKRLKDVFESNVDEKYYLSSKLLNYVFSNGGKDKNIRGGIGICDKDSDVSPTLTAQYYKMSRQSAYYMEPLSCAMRGRNLDNPSDRVKGCVTGQRLEIGDDKANTITTVQKDSMVIEPQVLTPKRNEYGKAVRKEYESGLLDESRHNMTYLMPREDGISNTITGVQKDNLLCEPNKEKPKKLLKILDNGKIRGFKDDKDKKGCSDFQIDNKNSIASTVISAHIPKCYGESMGFRIRKLTPREVFRLQDVDDEDIDELLNSGISNTRLYCMAGNSITVNVLYHIFRKLFIEKENENQQLTLF